MKKTTKKEIREYIRLGLAQDITAYDFDQPAGRTEEMTMEGKYTKEAAQFCEYIRTIASKPDNLDNLESYLSFNFGDWLKKYAYDPQNMVAEMREFANMII